MGVTLVSIGKIDAACYAVLFHKGLSQIFSSMKEKKLLVQIPMVNGLYQVEHQGDVDLAAAVDPEVVSIKRLHWLMGHIALSGKSKLEYMQRQEEISAHQSIIFSRGKYGSVITDIYCQNYVYNHS